MKLELLRTIPIFSSLSETELQKIANICEKKQWTAGEFLFKENESGEELYIIAEGAVEILKSTVADQMKSLTVLKNGDFLGEFSLFTDLTRSAHAKSNADTVVYSIHRSRFHELAESDHSLGYKIMKNMMEQICIRLNQTNKKFQEHVFWGMTSLM